MWFGYVSARNRTLRGDRVALIDDTKRMSFAELDTRSSALARGLANLGLGPGDRVALLSRNRAEVVESYFALGKLGAAAVPVNHGLVTEEVQHVVDSARVAAVLGEASLIEDALGSSAPDLSIDFEDSRYAGLVETRAESPLPEVGADALAVILFTSATTGRAKGVLLDQASFRASTLNWLATVGLSNRTAFLNCTPLFHSTVTIAMAYLAGGATMLVMRTFTPQRALELIERERVTHAYMVPSMINFCVNAKAMGRTDVSSVHEIIHGAAAMPIDQRLRASRAFGAALRDCYGQAEAGGPITLLDPVRDFPAREAEAPPALSSCGRPLLGVEVRVRDPEGDELPMGSVGDVFVRSASLMRGYEGQPEATAEVLADGWLRSGDLGYVDPEGYVHLVDRKADLIIRGGQNVYPAEVERVLSDHPDVDEVAVVGRPDRQWGEVPIAFVVARDQPPAESALLEFTAGRLASFKRPVEARVIDELPRNAAGKVLKKLLREETGERMADHAR